MSSDRAIARLVDIAEMLGVTKQRAHQLARGPDFPLPGSNLGAFDPPRALRSPVNDRLPAEEQMAEALAKFPPKVRALMLEVLAIRDDAERARRIGGVHADPRCRGFAEVLIDAEEDPAARAFLVGMLREANR